MTFLFVCAYIICAFIGFVSLYCLIEEGEPGAIVGIIIGIALAFAVSGAQTNYNNLQNKAAQYDTVVAQQVVLGDKVKLLQLERDNLKAHTEDLDDALETLQVEASQVAKECTDKVAEVTQSYEALKVANEVAVEDLEFCQVTKGELESSLSTVRSLIQGE